MRKTAPKNARYTLNRTTSLKSKLSTQKKIATKSHKQIATKKRVAPKTTTAPLFIGAIKKLLGPMHTELNRFEMQLKKHVKTAKANKRQLKTEASLQKRFNALCNNIARFKIKWFVRLNLLNRHVNKNIQMTVKQLKNEIEELRKGARRNLTILNRYSKLAAVKKGYKIQYILTPAETKAFEMKFNGIHTNVEKFRTKVDQYIKEMKMMKNC